MHLFPRRESLAGLEVELFKLVSHGATPKQWEEWLQVPLERAAARGNLHLFNQLLSAGANGNAGWRGCRDRTLLGDVTLGGNSDLLAALIREGAGPDVFMVPVSSSRSALYTATCCGDEAAGRQLILAVADVNFQDPGDNRSVLHKAVQGGLNQVVGDLLDAVADPNIHDTDNNGSAALHKAVHFGHEEIVSALLLRGADKDALNARGQTPLIHAVVRGRQSIVDRLLGAGVDLTTHATDDGGTALHIAATEGYDGIASALLRGGAIKNALNTRGQTPLMCAVARGHPPVVKRLLEASVDISFHATDDGSTALHQAAYLGHDEIVSAFVISGANTDALDLDGNTPLMWAVRHGHQSVVENILGAGVDLNVHATADGSTALHIAAAEGYDGIVSALLLRGADKDALENDGETPLMQAVIDRQHSVVVTLLESGVDLEIHTTTVGWTALHWAANYFLADDETDRIVSALLATGADVNAVDNEGQTPLMLAAARWNTPTTQILIDAGADMNICSALGGDLDGCTALHVAAEFGRYEIVSALLLGGANANPRDGTGRTPLRDVCYAKPSGLEEIGVLLLACGADETVLDDYGESPVDVLDSPPDDDYAPPCSQDEIDLIRTLLVRAPAERAWRRRGWLVMLRSRAKKMNRELIHRDCTVRLVEKQQLEKGNAFPGVDSSEGGTNEPGGGEAGSGGMEKGDTALGALVAVLVGLASEDVFRAIASFF